MQSHPLYVGWLFNLSKQNQYKKDVLKRGKVHHNQNK